MIPLFNQASVVENPEFFIERLDKERVFPKIHHDRNGQDFFIENFDGEVSVMFLVDLMHAIH